MKSKTISLGSNSLRIFYRQYAQLLNPILNLSNRQLDTLGILLYSNHKLSLIFNAPDNPIKWSTLFSAKSRSEMAKEIGMDKMNFNNNLKAIRDKGIIGYDSIKESILIDPTDLSEEFNVNFKFKIKTDESNQDKISKNG
jgi:hypothetical protein